MKIQNEILKKYFLGLLNKNEIEQVESRIFEDDAYEEALIIAENNLIEDYLDNQLTNTEIIAFNNNFLSTGERRKRVEFIQFLRNYAKKSVIGLENNPSFFERMKAFFSPFRFALGGVCLIFLFGIGFLIVNNYQKTEETEIAVLNKSDLSNLGNYQNLLTQNLSDGNLRSGTKAIILLQQNLTDPVLFRLALPAKISTDQIYIIIISRNGQILQSIYQHTYENQEIRLLLPKSILSNGEYQIKTARDSEKYSYNFVVQ